MLTSPATTSSALTLRQRQSQITMTLENLLSQMGLGSKQLTDRYAEYPVPAHDHLYYAYEPSVPSHEHVASSKHHYNGGHKNNAATSALTLLAFLFFLHILQQCLKEHMTTMSTPQVMVVSAGREEQSIGKTSKFDKAGIASEETADSRGKEESGLKKTNNAPVNATYAHDDNEIFLMKIQTAEHIPHKIQRNILSTLSNYANNSSLFSDYIKAQDEN